MGAICRRYMRKLILIFIALCRLTVELMASKINHVVFQSFPLGTDETVQCYGGCRRDGKVNVSRCDGRKIQFACASGEQIKIHTATIGTLNPDKYICKQSMTCIRNVTVNVQTICKSFHHCLVDVSSEKLKDSCSSIRYLAMDIKYACEIKPTRQTKTTTTVSEIQTSATKVKMRGKLTTPSKNVIYSTTPFKVIDIKTQTVKRKATVEASIVSPFIFATTRMSTKDVKTMHNKSVISLQKSSQTNMFWSMTAFTAITDSEFINKNKTHLAMALLLSMFVGMVLCLCFCLDYCRRQKKKRDGKCLLESKLALVPELHSASDSNENIELTKHKMIDALSANGSLPKRKIHSCTDSGCHNNSNGDCDIYTASPPFPPRNFEHKGMMNNRISPRPEKQFSAGSLPPPPNHFLVDSSSSSSNELSQQCDFNAAKKTSRWPSGSVNSTLSSSKKPAPLSKCNSEVIEVEEDYLEEHVLNECMEDAQFEYVEVGQYNDNVSDDEFGSGRISRPMKYHRTDNYVVPSNVKFASMNKRATNSDEMSHEDTKTRTLDLKRMRKFNAKDRPALHKSKSVDDPKRKAYFSSNGTQYVMRSPRKGRIHVMQRCEESCAPRSTGYAQKTIYSDNEASRRRRRCQVEYNRACSCSDQGTSLSDLYCKRCGNAEESQMTCCSSLTSNCQSSHDEDHGPLLSVSNERMKNKHCRVEESGYQTHDTGTDSLCSSTFSTDQEDSRMFLPAPLNNAVHRRCRCCVLAPKRDEKLIFVRNHNKSKVPRHNSHTCVDIHSYDSSMDDDNIRRDSLKIFRKIRKQNDCGLTGLDEDMNFKSIRGIVPDNMGTVSGIETT